MHLIERLRLFRDDLTAMPAHADTLALLDSVLARAEAHDAATEAGASSQPGQPGRVDLPHHAYQGETLLRLIRVAAAHRNPRVADDLLGLQEWLDGWTDERNRDKASYRPSQPARPVGAPSVAAGGPGDGCG